MRWFFLALLAPALDTIIIFVDKYLVEHRVKDSHCMPVYAGIAAATLATTLWLVFGMPTTTASNTCLLLASGFMTVLGLALYFHALFKDDASYINIALQTTPILILIMSAIFLSQPLSPAQLLGFFLVFGAVVGASIEKKE